MTSVTEILVLDSLLGKHIFVPSVLIMVDPEIDKSSFCQFFLRSEYFTQW